MSNAAWGGACAVSDGARCMVKSVTAAPQQRHGTATTTTDLRMLEHERIVMQLAVVDVVD